MADRIEKEPFHEIEAVDTYGTMSCSCGNVFEGDDAEKRWLTHLQEMTLRESREREIAYYQELTRPKGIITFDPPPSVLRRMFQRFVG